jgi:hypothetical protein
MTDFGARPEGDSQVAHQDLTVAVVLASAHRPGVLGQVIGDIGKQSRPADHLVVSVPDDESLPAQGVPPHCRVVYATGLTAQRNAGIDAVPDADVIFFFDDDAVVRHDYLERGVELFARHPEVVGLTGNVLLDGAATQVEISEEAAEEALRGHRAGPTGRCTARRTLYGCNFAYRADRVPDIRFDERLPLYSWLEDHDFARRLMRSGALVEAADCVIVHRGVKSGGRQAHVRFGYSQVMNPCYFVSSGSFPPWLAAWEIFRPTAKNVLYALVGPDRDWRRERLHGNALAARDVLRRRFTPERIREL